MKVSKKSINTCLDRRDVLRRRYILHGETGVVRPGTRTFAGAWLLLNDGKCVGIYDYGFGDAVDRRVACPYGGFKSIDITDIIADWISYNEPITRADVIDRICDAIMCNDR